MFEYRSELFLISFAALILSTLGCKPSLNVDKNGVDARQTGCISKSETPNYIGKNRAEIIKLCDNYKKYASPNGGPPKIMIGFNSGYRYYSNIFEALNDENLLKASPISINFYYGRKGLRGGLFFYRINFDSNGVAVSQKLSFMAN